jgi:hypothetical protein
MQACLQFPIEPKIMNMVFIHDLINYISYTVPVGHGQSADNGMDCLCPGWRTV